MQEKWLEKLAICIFGFGRSIARDPFAQFPLLSGNASGKNHHFGDKCVMGNVAASGMNLAEFLHEIFGNECHQMSSDGLYESCQNCGAFSELFQNNGFIGRMSALPDRPQPIERRYA